MLKYFLEGMYFIMSICFFKGRNTLKEKCVLLLHKDFLFIPKATLFFNQQRLKESPMGMPKTNNINNLDELKA